MKRLKWEIITKIHGDENERGQNTRGQGERVKIPLLPNNVGKKSANNARPKQGHNNSLKIQTIESDQKKSLTDGTLFLKNFIQ